MSTCEHCDTELSYGQHDIEGTIVWCRACDWSSPMMERRYLDLAPDKGTLANVAMTLDELRPVLSNLSVGRSVDYGLLNSLTNAVSEAIDSLRYDESESRNRTQEA